MLERILIPLDGSDLSEEVLPFAATLARGCNSLIVLVNVVDVGEFATASGVMHGHLVSDLIEHSRQWAESYLITVRDRLKGEGLVATTRVAVGAPADGIITQADANGAGLIAMSTHGRSGLARWTLGSVAEKVLREAGTPLLLYRATGEDRIGALGSLLLPLDGSPAAEQAVPLATYLTKTLAVPLTIARAIPTTVFALADDEDQMTEVLEAVEGEARDYLDQKTAEFLAQGLQVQSKFLQGDPAGELIALAKRMPDCMVVMSTAGRTGITRMVLGSVADRMVRHGHRPVVLVRAEE